MQPYDPDIWNLIRATDLEIAGQFHRVTDDITSIIRSYPDRPLTNTEYRSMMRRIDRVLDRAFGLRQGVAFQSDIYGTIVRGTDMAAEAPFRRLLQSIQQGAEARGPGLWARVHTSLLSGGAGPNDALARMMIALDGPVVEKQRFLRSGNLDPQRRWVPREKWTTTRGYRLSDRVWKQGRGVRGNITKTIRAAIRNGDGPLTLARSLEQYLSPNHWPTTYTRNGTVVRHARPGPYGASGARRLARTELSRVNAVATLESMDGVPGAIGVRWQTANTHAHIDVCTENAFLDDYGLGRGVYPVEYAPILPSHPNCMCVLAPVMKSRREVIDDLVDLYGG